MVYTFDTNNYYSNKIIGYTTTTAGPNNRHMRYLTRHKDNENMTIYTFSSLSLCRMQGLIILITCSV